MKVYAVITFGKLSCLFSSLKKAKKYAREDAEYLKRWTNERWKTRKLKGMTCGKITEQEMRPLPKLRKLDLPVFWRVGFKTYNSKNQLAGDRFVFIIEKTVDKYESFLSLVYSPRKKLRRVKI